MQNHLELQLYRTCFSLVDAENFKMSKNIASTREEYFKKKCAIHQLPEKFSQIENTTKRKYH